MKKIKRFSQCLLIIKHMELHGSITARDAMKNYEIMRPGARLDEIDEYMPLDRTWEKSNGKRYKRYRIAKRR